ncbi:MAG: HlyC/CorC family transporter [Clostridiales bacterium]|nr:HlyC/CorC family transporter [Clostridiales bacterium]
MDSHSLAMILMLAVLTLLSAYFSASETAFSSLNRIRMKNMAAAGNRRAQRALALSEDYDRLLSTILIGNNIVNIASASLATVLFTLYFGDAGVTLSTAVMTVIVLIFGEISPKSMAKENPDSFAMFSAPILKALCVVLTPVNALFRQWKKLLSRLFGHRDAGGITEEELITIVEEVESGGAIDEQEGELIRSAIEFDDQTASDILTPRVDIIAVEYGAPLDKIAEIFQNNGPSRLPVYDDTVDSIRGILHEKDFYTLYHRGGQDIAPILHEPLLIPPGTRLFTLLRRLQQAKSHMAVVIDEFGSTAGLVTMEDVLEELVGEIWDEHDRELPSLQQLSEDGWLAAGSANLEKLFEELDISHSVEEFDCVTVSGWIMQELGRIPSEGDTFSFDRYQVTVTRTERRRVAEARLEKAAPPVPAES